MTEFTEQLEAFVRAELGDPTLAVRLDLAWRAPGGPGEGRDEGRRQLRHAMAAHALALRPQADASALLDLARVPTHPELRFSASHARDVGGFACSVACAAMGFDIEDPARARPALAERIAADPGEAAAAPSPIALWVAKEAAYKALYGGGQQPATVMRLRVSGWRSVACALGTASHCEASLIESEGRLATPLRGLYVASDRLSFGFFQRSLN